MIYQFLKLDNAFTTDQFVNDWAPRLRKCVGLLSIEHLDEAKRLPVGTYIFSDLERIGPEAKNLLGQVHDQLAAFDLPMRLLNNPNRALNRLEFLSAMSETGQNDFRAFPAEQLPADLHFPVFVRAARDHRGPITPLIDGWETLEEALVTAALRGYLFDDLVVVEFCDTSDSEGTFMKYSAYRLGDRIIPRSLTFSKVWMVKGRDTSPVWRVEPKREYLMVNPHATALMPIFEMAGIEFGRADYSVKNGKLQVWELNTCPDFATSKPDWYFDERRAQTQYVADALAEGFEAIDQPPSDARVPISLKWSGASGR